MIASIINNSIIKNPSLLTQECVTINLFGLSTKILINDLVIFFIGLIATILLAEMLATYMVMSIENAINESKKRKLYALYLKTRIEKKERNKETYSQKIIQCDNCYNEYGEFEIKKVKIFKHIFNQYCTNCRNSQIGIPKSQSDSKFNYNNIDN